MIYLKAPPGWDETQPNPFTPDGSYGPEWSCFRIVDEPGERSCNYRKSGPYCWLPNRDVPGLETRLADFLRYETSHGRKVIVSCLPGTDEDTFVARALQNTPDESAVRSTDPRWLVHSTPRTSFDQINACGELRSCARLRKEGINIPWIGLFEIGEPEDYGEYVMFGDIQRIGSEWVVASQNKGTMICEEDVPYEPGVRLYFDAHSIIRDGLAVRDGLHLIKVHDHLPLSPYLLAAIGVSDVDPSGKVPVWTPRTFLDRTNECFASRFAVE